MKLEGKRIVLTGGTSGIGFEVVKSLSKNNELIVLSRRAEELEKLSNKFGSICTYQVNLSQIREVKDVAQQITDRYKDIDVLINNAAIQYTPSFLDGDFDVDSIQREINVNFTSVCCLCYLLLPSLLKQSRSLILNINSGLGLAPKTSSAVYCGTKGALRIFSQSLSYQLEMTNIRVLQAFMPLVDTPMTKGRGAGKISPAKAASEVLVQLSKESAHHYIGLVKLLRVLLRVSPTIAKKMLKTG